VYVEVLVKSSLSADEQRASNVGGSDVHLWWRHFARMSDNRLFSSTT